MSGYTNNLPVGVVNDHALSAVITQPINNSEEALFAEDGIALVEVEELEGDASVDESDLDFEYEYEYGDLENQDDQQNGGQEDQGNSEEEEDEDGSFDLGDLFKILRELMASSNKLQLLHYESFFNNLATQVTLLKLEVAKIREQGQAAAAQLYIQGAFAIASGAVTILGVVYSASKMRKSPNSTAGNTGGTASVQNQQASKNPNDTAFASLKKQIQKVGESISGKSSSNKPKDKGARGANDQTPFEPTSPNETMQSNGMTTANNWTFGAQAAGQIIQGIGQLIQAPFKVIEENARAAETDNSGKRSVESQLASMVQGLFSGEGENFSSTDQLIRQIARDLNIFH